MAVITQGKTSTPSGPAFDNHTGVITADVFADLATRAREPVTDLGPEWLDCDPLLVSSRRSGHPESHPVSSTINVQFTVLFSDPADFAGAVLALEAAGFTVLTIAESTATSRWSCECSAPVSPDSERIDQRAVDLHLLANEFNGELAGYEYDLNDSAATTAELTPGQVPAPTEEKTSVHELVANNPELALRTAMQLFHAEMYPAALPLFEEIVRSALLDARVETSCLAQLGVCYLQTGQTSLAERTLRRHTCYDTDRDSVAESYAELGELYLTQARWDEAEAAFLMGIQQRRSHARSQFGYARWCSVTGAEDKALLHLGHALRFDPELRRQLEATEDFAPLAHTVVFRDFCERRPWKWNFSFAWSWFCICHVGTWLPL